MTSSVNTPKLTSHMIYLSNVFRGRVLESVILPREYGPGLLRMCMTE